jgi:O-methyltransferase
MRFYKISRTVPCAHLDSEILSFAVEVFRMPASVEGCLVEAGCFKGGSTAKFSIVAKLAGRPLVAFDSFEGIPDNDEDHGRTLYGGSAAFRKGDYCGGLEEVTENVRRYGEIAGCRFIKGYFESTMPGFHESVAATYLDVDLASSTKICLKYLWPLLPPGAIVFSQDGQLPLVLDVLRDTEFWRTELETNPPELIKRESQKLIWFRKPAAVAEAYGLGRQHRVEQAVFREHSLQPDTEPRVTAPPDEEML